MKLTALHSIKGLKPNDEYTHAGETFDIDQAEAERLIDAGAAKEITEETEEEEPFGETATELEAEETEEEEPFGETATELEAEEVVQQELDEPEH